MPLTDLIDQAVDAVGLGAELPCRVNDPELWFAERPEDVDRRGEPRSVHTLRRCGLLRQERARCADGDERAQQQEEARHAGGHAQTRPAVASRAHLSP